MAGATSPAVSANPRRKRGTDAFLCVGGRRRPRGLSSSSPAPIRRSYEIIYKCQEMSWMLQSEHIKIIWQIEAKNLLLL